MKALFHIILFFVFSAMVTVVVAQDDVYDTPPVNPKKEKQRKLPNKINSGFVFINGKYIEPPYMIKQKKTGYIYINGVLAEIRLQLLDTVLNPYRVDSLPKIPLSINKNTTFKELTSVKYNGDHCYFTDLTAYYNTHYPDKEAWIKAHEAIRKIPCVKSFEGDKIELYDGEIKYIVIDIFWDNEFFKHFGIYSKRKLPSKNKIRKKGKKHIESLKESLMQNDALIFYKYTNVLNKENQGFRIINEIQFAREKDTKKLIEKNQYNIPVNYTPQLKNRIQNIKQKYIKKGVIKSDSLYDNRNKTRHTSIPVRLNNPTGTSLPARACG